MTRLLDFALVVLASTAQADESLYEVLGIETTATPAEVRSAYRKLALKLHPDKTSGGPGLADTTARFIKVSEAYATLSDKNKRAQYDATRQQWWRDSSSRPPSGAGATSFEFKFSLADAFDVLESFLNSHPTLTSLATGYSKIARATLERWPGFHKPLPELIASGLLKSAVDQVDWSTVGDFAKKALRRSVENDDGSVNWGKVAAATDAGVTAMAAALDAAHEGNRTSTVLTWGRKLLNFVQKAARLAGASTSREGRRPHSREVEEEEGGEEKKGEL